MVLGILGFRVLGFRVFGFLGFRFFGFLWGFGIGLRCRTASGAFAYTLRTVYMGVYKNRGPLI